MAKYCRICINKIEDDDYKPTQACNLPHLIKLYLPELTTDVADSVACLRCFSVLQLFHTLRSNALRTETKVQSYAGAHPGRKIITMDDVLGIIEEQTTTTTTTTTTPVAIKTDSTNDEVFTIDDSSGDEDEVMLSMDDMIVKEDNDLGVEIKFEDEDSI